MDFEERQYYHFKGIIDIIATLGWRQFIKEPKAILESIVWKLYANILDVVDNRVRVLSVLVPFGPSNINSHNGLMDMG